MKTVFIRITLLLSCLLMYCNSMAAKDHIQMKLKDGNVSFDTIADPNNPISIPHNILTRMGLEVLRLFLMGVDPYMRAVVRRVVASNGETLHLKRIMYGVSHSAIAMNNDYELEDDDDFDFSSIDGLDF